jgi:hypothetical protein
VREHVQHVQALQGREADRRAHVVGEDEEGRAVGNEAAVRGHAVDDRAHRVLAHAEVQVAARRSGIRRAGAGGRRCVEVAAAFQRGVGGRIEVGRSAGQLRQLRRDRREDLAAGHARRQALLVGREAGHGRVPGRGELQAQPALEFGGDVGMGAGQALHPLAPLALEPGAALERLAEVAQGLFRHEEVRLRGPAQCLLGLGDILLAERRAVRLVAVLLGRAVADVRAHGDHRRARGLGHAGRERAVDGLDVVAVLDADRLPAVGLEALQAIFREGQARAAGERDFVVVVEADELAQAQVAGE